jgi:hypothetical protein
MGKRLLTRPQRVSMVEKRTPLALLLVFAIARPVIAAASVAATRAGGEVVLVPVSAPVLNAPAPATLSAAPPAITTLVLDDPARSSPEPIDPATADVVFTGKVHADEVQWHVVPNIRVQFHGSPGMQSEWSSTRENLPRPVEAGKIYRDVGAEVRILTRLPDQKSIQFRHWYTAPPQPPKQKAGTLRARPRKPAPKTPSSRAPSRSP